MTDTLSSKGIVSYSAKHIGIASITAEGGALAYREIVHASELLLGTNHHPEITLHTHPFAKFADALACPEGVWDALMIEASQKLALTGADFFICPANTNHVVYDRVRDAVAIPWLHIASIVAEYAADLQCKRALLLGTVTLMQSMVYPPFFESKGIELRVPDPLEQQELNRIIYDELVRGRVVDSSKAFVTQLIEKYVLQQQCDSVVLGCTELPLLGVSPMSGVKILDSTRLVAHGAVAYSLGLGVSEVERLIAERETT